MSKNLATGFCNLCYKCNTEASSFELDKNSGLDVVYKQLLLLRGDIARSQAIQTLRAEINDTKNESPDAAESSPIGKYIASWVKSLDACGNCDYKNPMIAKALTEKKEK